VLDAFPKSHIIAAGRNVNMDFPEIFKHQVDKNAPLPTGEPIEKMNEEASYILFMK
jgi:hypothetical protein